MNNETNYKICDMCGNLVDNNNIFNIQEKEVCKTCVEKNFENKKDFSPLATFMCSLIPGIAHIYLGKKQKGLFLLNSFILNTFATLIGIFFLNNVYIDFISPLIIFLPCFVFPPILSIFTYLYSIFDANISRKYIEDNTYKDGFIDRLSYKFIKSKDKTYLQDKIIDKRLQ